jgi:transcriptional regulator ATRX
VCGRAFLGLYVIFLVVVPKNVVLNWRNEFDKWLGANDPCLENFTVYELDSFKEDRDRLQCLRNWKDEEEPSVMIIGYDMYRILCQRDEDRVVKKGYKPPPKPKKISKKQKKFMKMQEEFRELLQDPGPDLVVCDEAHKLKNDETLLARTMFRMKTKRRLCLTGTPLQNNLKEYYVMVSFVRSNLLGTKAEFNNQFVNIIEQGRTKDATDFEVRLMRKRCFVLFERLNKIVQRKDISVLKQEIPGKLEYVIKVRLTDPQVQLYKIFLDMVDKEGGAELRKRLLSDYHIFSRIWTHPYQLYHHAIELERKNMLKDDGESFIDDDESLPSDSDDDLEALDSGNSDAEQTNFRQGTRHSRRIAKDSTSDLSVPSSPVEDIGGWWSHVVTPNIKFNLEMSNKLVILFDIIKRCEAIGDKLLVFSQSLESLRLIRDFLEEFDKNDKWYIDGHECLAARGEKWGWKRGYDYLVIDGSVQSRDRENIQERFNKKTNLRARLMLISTRAGSLGTNMVAANRVIIFDSCWNPSHDTQSLFRVYRIGQTKPVYIYRLVASGTMEECIYKRQVTKVSCDFISSLINF